MQTDTIGPSGLAERRRHAVASTLRDRIEAGLHMGVLHPGDRVESVRDVVATLHVRPRTVQEAYRQLVAEGLVQVRARSGVFVAATTPPAVDLPEPASILVEFFLQGLARGLAPSDVLRDLARCLRLGPVRAACVECNDDQVFAMQDQLQRDYGFEAVPVDLATLERGRPLPAGVAGADIVVTTQFHVAEAQRLARRLRRPLLPTALAPSFYSEVRRLLAAGPLWWICTDPRFAAKLPRMWPGRAIHPVVLGHDPLDAVPRRAQVYATRRAMERLPRGWHDGEVVTVRRAFSIETARALVAFRLKRSMARAAR